MIELNYANEDKSLSSSGWLIDYDQLEDISNQLASIGINCGKDVIESVLLIANGELNLLKRVLKELEIF